MAKYKDRRVRLRVDGGAPEELDINCRGHLQRPLLRQRHVRGPQGPKAVTHDGLFDLTIWHDYGLSDFIIKSKGVYNGDHITWNKTRYLQCRTLEAESDQEVLLEMDGEVPGKLPCRVSILSGAIRLKV
jgi:diacylglycerol kinase family enzyme